MKRLFSLCDHTFYEPDHEYSREADREFEPSETTATILPPLAYWLNSAYRRDLSETKIEAWALRCAGLNPEFSALLIQTAEEDFDVQVLAVRQCSSPVLNTRGAL